MSLLSRLFGSKGKAAPQADAEEYKGFRIIAQPAKEAQGFRIGALIEKEVGGTLHSHHLIRADTIADYAVALQASSDKAKQMIDEQGERLFN